MKDMNIYDSYGNTIHYLTQNDANVILFFNDYDYNFYNQIPEFHFVTSETQEALSVNGQLIQNIVTVKVPNTLLLNNKKIKLYFYLYTDITIDSKINEQGRTYYEIDIPIRPKPTPSNWDIGEDDITIHVEGGGGTTDYTDLSNKPSINGVTLSGNKTSVDLNLLEVPDFVESLPATNIDSNKAYYTLADKLFPSAENLLTGDYNTLVVADVNGTTKALVGTVATVGTGKARLYRYNPTYAYTMLYAIYGVSNNQWELIEEVDTASDDYATKMGWIKATETGVDFDDIVASFENVLYANRKLNAGNSTQTKNLYDNTNNTATISGEYADASLVNPYLWNKYKFINNAWVSLGLCNFKKLFDKVNASIMSLLNEKADSSDLDDYTSLYLFNTVINKYSTKEETNAALAEKEDKALVFNNITVATTDFVADSTFTDYGYKAVITCKGATSSMIADVYLDGASADLGVISSYVEEGTDSITIYSSSNENAITIKRIEVR